MRRLAAVVIGTAFVVSALLSPRAWAGPPTDQLKGQIERVLQTLDSAELKKEGKEQERRTALRAIANETFDFGETSRRALGPHWQARTAAEREHFVRLFSELLERSYVSKIESYGGERIMYTGETVTGEQATVKTKIVTKQGTEVPIDYRLLQRGDRWLVYDVNIEGISLVGNYRTQFNKIIQTSSYQELVKRLETKQDEMVPAEKPKRTS